MQDDLENPKYIEQAMRQCHSLSYYSLLDITVGLRIAADYIIQVNEICFYNTIQVH